MSVFDEIANDVPALVRDGSTPLPPDPDSLEARRDSGHFHTALMQVGELVLNAKHKRPKAFVGLLRQACLDKVCGDTLLELSGEEAQVVVDAIQLVSTCVYASNMTLQY
jgi:hypothetical protein